MGWLWQLGARWIGSRVWSQATQAATSEVAKVAIRGPAAGTTAVFAVLCQSKLLFNAVADELTGKSHFEADQLVIEQGSLHGVLIVVARPLGESIEPLRMATAIVDGHLPRFAVSVAEGTCLDASLSPGTLVVANRVLDAEGKSVSLDGRLPAGNGVVVGAVATAEANTDDPTPVAEDTWSAATTRACQRVGLPLIAVSALLQLPEGQRSRETQALRQQRSLAGRAGVLAGMLFKKQSGFKDLWNEKQATWQAVSTLASLVRYLAKSSAESKADE